MVHFSRLVIRVSKTIAFNKFQSVSYPETSHHFFCPKAKLGELRLNSVFQIRLMFEWGGGALWCGNDEARSKFGVGPIEDALPISYRIRSQLLDLTKWHDTALNWEYPPDPSSWSEEEWVCFNSAAEIALHEIQTELGPSFEVKYVPL